MGLKKRYELAPGVHAITISLNSPGHSADHITRTFLAKAGKRHVADFGIDAKAMRWWVHILDEGTPIPVDH